MKTFTLVIILVLLIVVYLYQRSHQSVSPRRQVFPERAPRASDMIIERVTGKTAIDQFHKAKDIREKVRTSPRQQMPNF